MRRSEVNVFLVAMAILPFLQNLLLNIGTGHYIHECMYTVYLIFRQNFSDIFSFAISEKTLAETVHYIPKVLRKGNPFQCRFAQLSYIYISIFILKITLGPSFLHSSTPLVVAFLGHDILSIRLALASLQRRRQGK